MQLVHYYLQKGISSEKILDLPLSEKMFYKASMELEIETEAKKYKALFGAGSRRW